MGDCDNDLDSKMNETCRTSENGRAMCFKSKCESIFVVVAVSFSFESKIKGDEEAYDPDKGNGKGKLWMAVESMAK